MKIVRWIEKFLIVIGIYGGCISFGVTFAKSIGREPAVFGEWDMYTALVLAFFGAFFDWRDFR